MACLKCGEKTQDSQVFCPNCLEVMAQHPVKPDAVVHIPQRAPVVHEKRPAPRIADQLAQQRKLLRWLAGLVAALALLLCVTGGMLIHLLKENAAAGQIGTNYHTAETWQP